MLAMTERIDYLARALRRSHPDWEEILRRMPAGVNGELSHTLQQLHLRISLEEIANYHPFISLYDSPIKGIDEFVTVEGIPLLFKVPNGHTRGNFVQYMSERFIDHLKSQLPFNTFSYAIATEPDRLTNDVYELEFLDQNGLLVPFYGKGVVQAFRERLN